MLKTKYGIASKIKLVATDIDGVWTDGGMYYGADGEVMKRFNTYDGMAVALLRENGIEVAVLTGEDSPSVSSRMKKLGIVHYFPGEKNKRETLLSLCEKLNISIDETAYIGDDVNDLEVINEVGLSALAGNSPILEMFSPDHVTTRLGGYGAFREFADIILAAKKI